MACLLISWTTAAAQEELAWSERTPVVRPSARSFPAMVYDSARERVVVFGGGSRAGLLVPGFLAPLGDTWEWDGVRWIQRTPAVSPPGRWGGAMAYDSVRQRVVFFGGTRDETGMNDTWEWDGEEWTQRTPTMSPPARWNHALAYDSKRGRVILFGGLFGKRFPGTGGPGVLGDTWEWDGEEWTQRTPAVSPPARLGHGLAYDSARDRTVLFGGLNECCSREETWEWDGSEWLQRLHSGFTSNGRHNIVLVYDTDRELSVFFGGRAEGSFATTFFYNDILAWDGNEWSVHEPYVRPAERSDYGLAYDSARRQIVLSGGADTWVYGIPETSCDGQDDNANSLVDEGCDDDGDGYCDTAMTAAGSPTACPNGVGDCNDGDSAIRPGAADIPGDVVDEDCDGSPACNPSAQWGNRGEFVGCIARACGQLVARGAISGQECTLLVQSAAQGAVGR